MQVLGANTSSDRPPIGPDRLAGALLRSLTRDFRGLYSWGVIQTLLIGGLSGGVLPLLSWSHSLRQYIRHEQQQLWHLAEWMRLQNADPNVAALLVHAERIRPRLLLSTCAHGTLAMLGIFFTLQLWNDPAPLSQLIGSARYGPFFDGRVELFIAWQVGVSLAYVFHWLAVQLHAADVRRFVQTLNTVAKRQGLPPLSYPPVGTGARPLWLLGMLPLIVAGSLWALPMMLAGAVQRGYISRTSARLRLEAADGVRTFLLRQRPVLRLASLREAHLQEAHRCAERNCGCVIAPLANFCVRCGARAAPGWSEVA